MCLLLLPAIYERGFRYKNIRAHFMRAFQFLPQILPTPLNLHTQSLYRRRESLRFVGSWVRARLAQAKRFAHVQQRGTREHARNNCILRVDIEERGWVRSEAIEPRKWLCKL